MKSGGNYELQRLHREEFGVDEWVKDNPTFTQESQGRLSIEVLDPL